MLDNMEMKTNHDFMRNKLLPRTNWDTAVPM